MQSANSRGGSKIMKWIFLFLVGALSIKGQAKTLPHLDLGMVGSEYETLIENDRQILLTTGAKHPFDDIFATGKRNLDWIKLLNQNRKDRISLSTPETQQGYPITNPRIYNPQIIREAYNELKQNMPETLKKVIFGTDPLPTELPCTVAEYIQWGLQVDRTYQIAARWRTYEPYRQELLINSKNDVRGFYFISNTPGLIDRIDQWENLSPGEREQVTVWLQQVCVNDLGNQDQCHYLTAQAIRNHQAKSFFFAHRKASEDIVTEMMLIPTDGSFRGFKWNSKTLASVPFVDPSNEEMKSYLINNIETEWQISPFALKVQWVPENLFGVKVIWNPGITPHVPGLGSNLIYMDSNAPISEYDVQWTIRHEFGHVLGFPDCYVEFYDTHLNAIVGYQMDTSDLMCSRQGHLKDRHVRELERVYHQ